MKNERKKLRLSGYDYSSDGYYFVTMLVKNRVSSLGFVQNNNLILSDIGEISKKHLLCLEEQYCYIKLVEYIIMPNHIHVIVRYDRNRTLRSNIIKIKPLYSIIAAFKTTSSKELHKKGYCDFQWHRSFYDHIIRDEESLMNICRYIKNNPLKWEDDKYF